MARKHSLFHRSTTDTTRKFRDRAERRAALKRLVLEQLEDRRLLAASVFVNDDWHHTDDDGSPGLTIGDTVDNRNDTGGAPTITKLYGVDAFGVASSGANPGFLPTADEINDSLAAVDVGGSVNFLPGAYSEHIVVNQDVSLSVTDGVALIQGNSPALTVASGIVSVSGLSLTTSTDDPTVIVSGGELTMRESFVEESTTADNFAFRVTGGTLNLGVTGDMGSNSITTSGAGGLIDNGGGGGGGGGAFPWETSLGDEVLLGSTDSSRSADDVIGNVFDDTEVFATQTGSTSQQGIMKFTLTRDGTGDIIGATRDYVDISTLNHNNSGLKALDIYGADSLFYTLEEGGSDDDGLIGLATSLAASPLTHTVAADLTSFRTGGGTDFDPEGIAIDRANNFLYVMTDDGPNSDVAQYSINPGTLALSFNWVTTIDGSPDGNDGIVLSDGRVAAVSGTSAPNVYAISQDGGTVTNLLGGAIGGAGRDTPQDLLEFGGFLYVAWESGIIDAFDLSAPSTTPTASIDLDAIIGSLSIGGIGITTDGHLLIGTRAAGGSTGEVYALNSTAGGGAPAVAASGNWWGSNAETTIESGMTGPVDFTPFLDGGVDTDGGTAGFQGDFSVLNVTALGDQIGPGGRVPEAVDAVDSGGTVKVLEGLFLHDDTLLLNKPLTLDGAGKDVTEIRSAGAPSGNFDEAIKISASDVTISNAQLGWGDSASTDYQGYVVVTNAADTTVNNILFGEGYRSAVVFEGANNLEVSDSIFEGLWGRGAIRDGNSGSGENFLITRNEFREDHFRWGPIAIGPQGVNGDPNNEPFSGEISFNYFGNGLQAGAFQELGDQNYTLTVTNEGMTAAGLVIDHNTFDWQDRDTVNSIGNYATPAGVFFDPNLTLAGPLDITDNIFNGFEFGGSGAPAPPDWSPAGGQFGGALRFDGVDDFATFRDPLFDVGAAGTLNFWVNMDDVGKRNQFFEGPGDGGFEAQYRSNSGGQFFGRANTVDDNDFVIQSGGAAGGALNTWTNLQYTWDFALGEMRIYIDGTEVTYDGAFDENLSDWSQVVETVDRLFYIGRDPNDSSRAFDGLMDDIGWFDGVLDATDRNSIRTTGVAALSGDGRLVAHWDLDTAAGFTELDNKNGIELTVFTQTPLNDGPQFRPSAGQFGGALEFDGVDDFGTFQDATFDVGEIGSLNLWVNLNDATSRNKFFEGPNDTGPEFAYRDDGTGQFFGSPGRAGNSNNFAIQDGGAGALAHQWVNLQYTWDYNGGVSPEMHIYVDGVEVSYLSATFDSALSQWVNVFDTKSELFHVGRDASSVDRFFGGLMDDVAWYDDVLTTVERDAIRTSGVSAHADLVAHWNFDDPVGTTSVSGDSGTSITMELQFDSPPPPSVGVGVIAPAGATLTTNAFHDNDTDSNQVLDASNKFGDPQFFGGGATLEDFYTIGFGSSAAYMSSEFALDHLTLTPHIGAFQNDPGLFGSGDILIVGTDDDDLLELTATGIDSAVFTLTRDVGGVPNVLGPVILTNVTSLRFDGFGGDDIFRINTPLTASFFAPVGGIDFNGGLQAGDVAGNPPPGDLLEINGAVGLTADTVLHRFDASSIPAEGHDGQIEIEIVSLGLTGGNEAVIRYTGLEPIDDNMDVDDRIFSFTDAAETITLTSPGGLQDNNIGSSLSESVNFNNPNLSLTINTEALGGTGADTINLNSLDSDFDANFTINAGVDDDINVNGTIEIGAGDFDIEGNDINLAGGSLETTGDVTLTATGADGTITSSGVAGEVTGNDLFAGAVDGITLDTDVDTIDAGVSGAGGIDIDETSGVTLVNVTTGDGAIRVDAGGAITATNVDSSATDADANDITLTTTSGAIDVGVIDAGTEGDVTLNAAGAITDGNGDGTLNVTADDVIADAGGGIELDTDIDTLDAATSAAGAIDIDELNAITLVDVSTSDGSITVDAGGAITATLVVSNTDANANDISLRTTSGDITIGSINAGTTAGDVFLSTPAGIEEDATADAAADIEAHEAELIAGTGIGDDAQLEIQVTNLAATTASGDVTLQDTSGGLTITDVNVDGAGSATSGVRITAGGAGDHIIVRASSPLNVFSPVSNAGGGDITLAAEGTTAADDMDIDANITATGGNGNINLYAGDAIDIAATVTISTAGTGDILVSASTDYAGGTPANGFTPAAAGDGDVVMNDGSVINAGGDATLRGAGDVDLSDVRGDTVVITADFDGVGGLLSDGTGEITDNLTGEGSNVTASVGAAFRAGSGIGDASVDDGDIDIDVPDVAATTVTGDISLQDTGALDITTVDSLAGVSITTGGAGDEILIREEGTGDFQVQAAVSNAGTTKTSDITLWADGTGELDIETAGDISAMGGDILLISFADIDFTGSPVVSTTGTGSIRIDAGRVYAFGGSPLFADSGTDGDILDGGQFSITTVDGTITLAATNDIQLDSVNADTDSDGVGVAVIIADSDSNGEGAIVDNLPDEAVDGASGINVTAGSVILIAAEGIGSANDIDTDADTIAVSNTIVGDVRITNRDVNASATAGLLTIGTVAVTVPADDNVTVAQTLVGVTNDDDNDTGPLGEVVIVNSSPLDVDDDVISDGAITLIAMDSAAAGDDLSVAPTDTAGTGGVDIISNFGSVNLAAGDNLTIPMGTLPANQPSVQAGAMNASSDAADDINIDVDNTVSNGGADPDAAGSTVTIAAETLFIHDDTQTGPFFSFFNSANITGGEDNDVFDLFPQVDVGGRTGAPIRLDGAPPVFPPPAQATPVPPGDTLLPNFSALVSPPPTLLLGPSAGSGQYFFTPGPEKPLGYISIETVSSTDPYHLAMDLTVSPGPDVMIQLDGDTPGENLEIYTGTKFGGPPAFTEFFEGDIDDILSFQLYGNGVANSLTINDVNGLPVPVGVLPSILLDGSAAPNNLNVAGTPSIFFDGRGGAADSIWYMLGSGGDGNTSQTYGLGDGIGGGYGADVGTAVGEILTVDPTNTQSNDAPPGLLTAQSLYFRSLEPIATMGTPGGTLTIVGDLENQLIQVVDADTSSLPTPAPLPAPVGFTRIQAWNENRDDLPWRFAPYEYLDFAANAFTALVIEGLGGDDIIDFISFDAAEMGAGLATGGVELHGGDGNDVLSVNTNNNGSVPVTITVLGETGDDDVHIAALGESNRVGPQPERVATHSLDAISPMAPVMVIDDAAFDTLLIDDGGELIGHTYGFVAGTPLGFGLVRDGTLRVDYSPGSDDVTLLSGSESDTFLISGVVPPGPPASPPVGVTHIVDGGGDMDKIDFSTLPGAGAIGIVWDMDTEAIQHLSGLLPGGPLLQARGKIENFIGTPRSDVVFIDPLAVPRGAGGMPIAGGGGEDTLFFDPMGAPATDSGAVISVAGFAPIAYTGFGSVQAWGVMPPLVVDNSDAGFSATGGFIPTSPSPTNDLPLGNTMAVSSPATDLDASFPGDAGDGTTDQATWTFSGIPNGHYAVYATWPDSIGERAIDATYTIYDAAFTATGTEPTDDIVGGAIVDQNYDPSQLIEPPIAPFTVPGLVEWRPLDFVQITSNTLTVSLTDLVTDRPEFRDLVLADAIRIELLPPGIMIDNGDPQGAPDFAGPTDDPSTFTATGGTTFGPTTLDGFSDYHQIEPGSGHTATWSTGAGLPGGTYLVSTSWRQLVDTWDRAAPFSINAGPTIFVDQDAGGPAGFFELGGMPWRQLGVVTIPDGGSISVTLSDAGITRPVNADAILIQPIGALSVADGGPIANGGTFDFGDTRIGEVVYHTFTATNTSIGPLNLSDLVVEGDLMQFSNIPGGFEGVTDLSATVLPPGASATFTVRFGADLQASNPFFGGHTPAMTGPHTGTVRFNSDAFDPTLPFDADFEFSLIGSIEQPQPRIIDNDNPNWLNSEGAPVGSYRQSDGGLFFPVGFSRPNFQSGYSQDIHTSPAGSGNTATWDFGPYDLPDGIYEVAVTWSNVASATAAPFTITTLAGTTAPITVDQTVAPDDFESDGGVWEVLTNVSVTGGVLSVELGDAGAGGLVIADAVRVQRVDLQIVDQITEFAVIDDGDVTFEHSPGTTPISLQGTRESLNNDFQVIGTASGDSATWRFDVDPGTYVVGVSWDSTLDFWTPGPSSLATDAAYTITSAGNTVLTGAAVNQSIPASDDSAYAGARGVVVIDGKYFQILDAAFVVPALSKEIDVIVGSSATGVVIADAAFVLRIADPPLPLVAEGTPGVGADPTAVASTGAQLDALVAAAIARWTDAGVDPSFLNSIDVTVADLPGNLLGQTSPFLGQVTIDVNAAGFGWFADATPGLDEEFIATQYEDELVAMTSGPANQRIDLLTVLVHEFGHLLGLDDEAGHDLHDVMSQSLPAGVRRLPTEAVAINFGHANPTDPYDVNADGILTTEDLLAVLSDQLLNGARELRTTTLMPTGMVDVDNNGIAEPLDLLLVLGELLNQAAAGAAEGEAPATTTLLATAAVPLSAPAPATAPAAELVFQTGQWAEDDEDQAGFLPPQEDAADRDALGTADVWRDGEWLDSLLEEGDN